MNSIWYVIILIISVFVASISQIILKKSSNEKHKSLIKEYLNVKVITRIWIACAFYNFNNNSFTRNGL